MQSQGPRVQSTVLTFSGGIDSTTLLYYLKYSLGHQVRCLSVDYGQRHAIELNKAASICACLGIEHKIVDLKGITSILAGSSQTSPDIPVPEGHYAEESMKQTVVPNRNMILLAIAGAWAVSTKSNNLAYAAHAGDHAIYPDCRPLFADVMAQALTLCDWHPVIMMRPFINKTKADIVKLGAELRVPFARTYSCYKGKELHCGKCGTCTERREAHKLSGVADPLFYEN